MLVPSHAGSGTGRGECTRVGMATTRGPNVGPLRIALAGIVAVSLAACASNGEPGAPAPAPAAATIRPGVPVYNPAKPAFTTRDVLGKTAQELDARLGAPALIKSEGVGELRRYDLSACALVVLLKRDGAKAATSRDVYASKRTSTGPDVDLQTCLGVGSR